MVFYSNFDCQKTGFIDKLGPYLTDNMMLSV